MATRKGVEEMTGILLAAAIAGIVLVGVLFMYSNWFTGAQGATQARTVDTAKQAVVVQTRDLPDLKIVAIGAVGCNRITHTITLPARLGNFGAATAVAVDEDEGLLLCGENAKYSITGMSDKTLDITFTPRRDSAGKRSLTELTANTKGSTVNFDARINDYGEVRNQDCPNVLRFDPTVDCRNDIEELNEDNNAAARVKCTRLSCTTTICNYECLT
jgi:hypothetical protein